MSLSLLRLPHVAMPVRLGLRSMPFIGPMRLWEHMLLGFWTHRRTSTTSLLSPCKGSVPQGYGVAPRETSSYCWPPSATASGPRQWRVYLPGPATGTPKAFAAKGAEIGEKRVATAKGDYRIKKTHLGFGQVQSQALVSLVTAGTTWALFVPTALATYASMVDHNFIDDSTFLPSGQLWELPAQVEVVVASLWTVSSWRGIYTIVRPYI